MVEVCQMGAHGRVEEDGSHLFCNVLQDILAQLHNELFLHAALQRHSSTGLQVINPAPLNV